MKLEGTRVRLQLDIDAAKGMRLRISSKLLGMAEIVKSHR